MVFDYCCLLILYLFFGKCVGLAHSWCFLRTRRLSGPHHRTPESPTGRVRIVNTSSVFEVNLFDATVFAIFSFRTPYSAPFAWDYAFDVFSFMASVRHWLPPSVSLGLLSKESTYSDAVGTTESRYHGLSPWTKWLFRQCWCPASWRASTTCWAANGY